MKLGINQIKSITLGVEAVEETERGVVFYRFTEEQRKLYENRSSFKNTSYSTSGVKFRFRTDSNTLHIEGNLVPTSSRYFFSFDLFVNGERVDTLDNFTHLEVKPNYLEKLPFDAFEKTFDLGEGEKEVLLYFPWNAIVYMKEVSLSDNSFIEPVKPEKKMLCFGDSITQGYDADFPSNSYISRLARKLGYEEINKGIGGEIFFPALASSEPTFRPEIITVAYGTNDWNCATPEKYESYSRSFYENLSKNYPDSKIFAITPIWRKNYLDEKPFGPFERTHTVVEEVTKDLPNVTVIRGFDFVPKKVEFFSDRSLHPNDEGFSYYAESLYKELKKYL